MAKFKSYAERCDEAGIEVFYHDVNDCEEGSCWIVGDGVALPSGWYWWSCQPGCLPDGEPSGPYDTEREAMRDALDGLDY